MKKFIPLNQLFVELRNKKLSTWLDKLNFSHIFIIWMSIVVTFGVMYHFLSTPSSLLIYTSNKEQVTNLVDKIYFSFITATTTGFGDIIPLGFFKVVAIFEVISGLLLLAFVTSKLISIKQDIILNEIYELSFNEKINRLRSSLLVFRQNISRIINKIEENSIRKRQINDMYIYISSLEDILNDITSLIDISGKSEFKKVLDTLSTELLFNSIINSFEKLNELITLLNQNKSDWRRDITINLINRCISITDTLFAKLNSSKNLTEKTITDLNIQKNKITEMIKSSLKPSEPVNVV